MPRRGVEAGAQDHGGAIAAGAIAGVAVAALVAGSVILLIVLLLGAVGGGLLAGIGALAVDSARGRPNRSPEHPMPTLGVDGGPAAQRAEAGHVSPSPR